MGGSSQPTTSTTNTEPWTGQQPYLKNVYSQAQKLYGYEKPIYETINTPSSYPVNLLPTNLTNSVSARTQNRENAQENKELQTMMAGVIGAAPPRQRQVGTEWVEGTGKLDYFPNETVAGFTPAQIEAQNSILQRAREGSPLIDVGQEALTKYAAGEMPGYLQKTLSGEYLSPDSNPWLPHYVERGFENVLPQLDTTAIKAGRYGSDTWGQMRGQAMGDTIAGIYGPAYESERGRMWAAEQLAPSLQMQAIQMSPDLAQMDYYDLAQMSAVGEEQQALKQAEIDAAKEKWNFEEMEPWQRLGMFSNLIQGDAGGQTVSYSDGGK